jgi:hypothetical protein
VPAATAEKIATKVAQVQSVAARVCRFVPTAETIASLFLAESNARSTVQGLANLACRAVATAGAYASLPPDAGGRAVSGVALVNGHRVAVRGRLNSSYVASTSERRRRCVTAWERSSAKRAAKADPARSTGDDHDHARTRNRSGAKVPSCVGSRLTGGSRSRPPGAT